MAKSTHDATSLLLRDDDEIGQPCVFRGDGRASGLWFSARSTGKMKIPANASVHYVAATRKRDTRHCCSGVTQEIVLHTLDIPVAYSRNGVFMNFLWGHSSRAKYVAEFRSLRQDLCEICMRTSSRWLFFALGVNEMRITAWSIYIYRYM